MDENFVSVPISAEIYHELVLRYGRSNVNVAATIEDVVSDFLERTKDDDWGERYALRREAERELEVLAESAGDPQKGYQWQSVFLPNGTRIKMAYKGRDYYAEVSKERLTYEGEAFSPSELARRIASGTSRNAWRDLWIRRPRDQEWLLAEDLRKRRP